MKIWDMAWSNLMSREGIKSLVYKRYVDDIRNLLYPLSEGWRWAGNRFTFCEKLYEKDMASSSPRSDQIRTREELTKAMCSLVYFLTYYILWTQKFGLKTTKLSSLFTRNRWSLTGLCKPQQRYQSQPYMQA